MTNFEKKPLPNPNFSCERSLDNEVALIMKSHLNERLVNIFTDPLAERLVAAVRQP